MLPLLYLHGLSSGDFVPALEQFLGGTAGLSPATVIRLTKQWSDDHAAFQERDLSRRRRGSAEERPALIPGGRRFESCPRRPFAYSPQTA